MVMQMSHAHEQKLPERQEVLCSVPILLLVTIAALDSADKFLLAASFPILEKEYGLEMEALGAFSLFTNLSYALSLPFWAYLIHVYTVNNAHNLLAAACCVWGLASFGIASSASSIGHQAVFRSINGAALASILPLSQTMLMELVSPSKSGRAFGLMGLLERAAGTLAVSAVVWCNDWKRPYRVVGILSILMSLFGRRHLKTHSHSSEKEDENSMSLMQISRRIAKIPAFACLVGQGVFGAIPWDMMSFLLLLLDWKKFTQDEVVMIQFTNGVSGAIGGALGGVLGDFAARDHGMPGRVAVAFTSVVGGTLFYGLFLFSNSFLLSMLWSNLFQIWGGWTPAATNRPLCAHLARNPSERAQIVAAWILMEKTSAAVFGAPLVGYITKHMIDQQSGGTLEKAETLAWNMFWLSSRFWGICALFWLLMAHFLRQQSLYEALEESQRKSHV